MIDCNSTGPKKLGLMKLGRLALIALAAVNLLPTVAGGTVAAGESATTRLSTQELPEPVLVSLRIALEAYEEMRGELAADRLDEVPVGAARLADQLRQALDAAAGQVSEVLEEAALAAESMGEAQDLATARAAFGEVSRRLVSLAGADRRLAEGWHAFSCPMVADGFNEWLQLSEVLENPYMGRSMPMCGSPAEWSIPVSTVAEAPRSSASEAASPEPVFTPGIPGLKMVDVRDHKFLWREIDELQIWERGDRISVVEYRSKSIEKTVHFLELEGAAADAFAEAASQAVSTVRESFRERRQGGVDASGQPTALSGRFSTELRSAATSLVSLLGDEPRHQLFAPECKKWLLKLAFGPRESKEAGEAGDVIAGR